MRSDIVSEPIISGRNNATLQSVLLGVGAVVLVAIGIVIFYPRALKHPAAAPSHPVAQAPISVPPPETSAAPTESEPAAATSEEQAAASVSAASPGGEEAAASESASGHPRRPVRKTAHRVRHASGSAPAAAPVAASTQAVAVTPQLMGPDQTPNVIVGGRRSQGDVLSKRVSLADLDLSTDVGACTALRRIKRAAGDVCPDDGEKDLSMIRERQECVQDSVTRAVHSIHSAKIEDLRTRRGGC
jgi:UrcA family protein